MQRKMKRPHVWRTVLSFFFLLYRKFKLIKICLFCFFSFYLSKNKSFFFNFFLKTVRYTNAFYIFFPHANRPARFQKLILDHDLHFAYLHVIEVALNKLINFARSNLMNATLESFLGLWSTNKRSLALMYSHDSALE